jgi:catechol 2,3-dioxygenase-like lactoylglutathione lyase family enzyme
MEPIFSNLVDQFINGKLSRRGLIQSLAAAAAVAGAPATAGAAAPGRRDFKAIAVNHISYQSKDYGKARDFYASNFGMKVTHDNGKQCYLGFGSTILIVRQAQSGPTPLIDHVAYTIADYGNDKTDPAVFKQTNDAVKAELEARGFTPAAETDLSWAVHDPDGFKVQIAPELMKPGNPMFEKAVGGIAARQAAPEKK